MQRLAQYERLNNLSDCPYNTPQTNDNDAVDNEILYALERDAVHALVTEDRGIHLKARTRGLDGRVYYIQTAEDWLKRLSSQTPVSLPNITLVNLYQLDVRHQFFDSLRVGYGDAEFNAWFAKAAREDRKAWMYGTQIVQPEALCIFDIQTNEPITDDGQILRGRALKLCTFKVGEAVRGRKIGELFLKAAFRFATDNQIENIFITTLPDEVDLVDLLKDFGFSERGIHRGDSVFVKPHPLTPPLDDVLDALEYCRRYFPHFRDNSSVQKFIVPIKPEYHDILFPDYALATARQLGLFTPNVGNAIKLAYLCHAQTAQVRPGDVMLFYRSYDSKIVTSIGVVDDFLTSQNAEEIAGQVRRRTVYNMGEIAAMAEKPTKVLTFRLVKHFTTPITFVWLKENGIVNGNIQSIQKIDEAGYRKLSEIA